MNLKILFFTWILISINIVSAQECFTDINQDPLEPPHPYKDGKYWDQGLAPACEPISIINLIIDLFEGIDENSKFKNCMDECMWSKGLSEYDLAPLYAINRWFDECLKECVKKGTGEQVNRKKREKINRDTFFLKPRNGGKSECEKLADLVNDPKTAVQLGILTKDMPGRTIDVRGHAVGLQDLDCEQRTLTIRDPNYPNDSSTHFTFEITKEGKIVGGTENAEYLNDSLLIDVQEINVLNRR